MKNNFKVMSIQFVQKILFYEVINFISKVNLIKIYDAY